MKSLILIAAFSMTLPNTVFAEKLEKIRESTVIYKINKNATPAQLKRFNSLVHKNNTITKREIKGVGIIVIKLRDIKGLEKAFSKQLMDTGAVNFAEPDVLIPHDAIPNDTFYSLQWHHNTINSPIAWDETQGSNLVNVCILDTGADTDHPDLIPNLVLPGYNANDTSTDVIEDAFGHGTGTAGTAGAAGNNSEGIAGVAWNIGIVPVKINAADNSTSDAYISDMASGIAWCADQGIKVANLSYGGAQYSTIDSAAQYLKDSGGLLFMSAGNGGTYNSVDDFPDYTSFVVVGATNNSDTLTAFSEYGPFVDIVAPGEGIATTYLDGQYVYYTGTSFSSPMAAGLAALIYSINPDFSPSEVENFIFNTAVDLGAAGDDEMHGHGRIDAGAAVLAALDYSSVPNTPPVANAIISPESGYAPLIVSFDGSTSTDDVEIASYIWDFGDGDTGSGIETTHTYTNTGTFTATLTVTDNAAATNTSSPIAIEVSTDSSYVNAPTNLTTAVDGNSVTLTWSDNSGNETHFTIERAVKVRGKYIYESLGTVSSDVTAYTDEPVEVGSYKYRLYAANDTTSSDFSNEAAVEVEAALPTDPEPVTLSAPSLSTSVSGDNVTLNWSDECPADEVCTYHVEKGVKITGKITFSNLADIVSGITYTTVEGAGTYYYQVYFTTDVDTSDFSNIVTVRIK